MGRDEVALLPILRDIRSGIERDDLPVRVPTKDLNRCWYEAITGRISLGWHVTAVCYATAAILLVGWPWSFLLILLLFPIRNERVRFYAFPTVAAKESMRRRESKGRGSQT
jgi:hypothetical protein